MILQISDVKKKLQELYGEILENVEKSKEDNEEKLRVLTINTFINFFKEFGIDLTEFIELEKTSIGTIKIKGRIDALYGLCIIEFKKVGLLSSKNQRKKFTNQVIGKYLNPFPHKKRDSIVATIFDGKFLIFVRWDKERNDWIDDVMPFNEFALFEWVLLLTGTLKKRASIETLKRDFGLSSRIAREFIVVFYRKLIHTLSNNGRVRMLFDEWDKTFRYIFMGAYLMRIR